MGTTNGLRYSPIGDLYVNSAAQASLSGDAVVTTSYANDGIVRGAGFSFEKNFSIGIGSTLYLLYDYTTFVPTGGQMGLIYVLPPFFQTTAGPVIISVYRGTDYTGGTPFPCYNANTTATPLNSRTTFTSGPTGATKGALALEYVAGGASQGANTAGGSSSGNSFYIRPRTSKSLIEIVNNSGSAITFHHALVIYEL